MIVAHPDDETIFGYTVLSGAHVICVTCGADYTRRREFNRVLGAVGATGLILGFTDCFDGFPEGELPKLREWLGRVVPRYAKVVTHNPEGEYGHVQHRQLHQVVREVRGEPVATFCLAEPLSPQVMAEKLAVLALYESQRHVIELPLLHDWIYRGGVDGL